MKSKHSENKLNKIKCALPHELLIELGLAQLSYSYSAPISHENFVRKYSSSLTNGSKFMGSERIRQPMLRVYNVSSDLTKRTA